MTRSQGRQITKGWMVQVVHIEEPPLTSAAALALLAKKYFPLDKTIYTECRMNKLRDKWMTLQMKTPDEKGGLTCAICGRKGLQPFAKGTSNLAVLDHIKEIGFGGDWRDPANFQVACYDCNDKKNERLQKKLRKELTSQA